MKTVEDKSTLNHELDSIRHLIVTLQSEILNLEAQIQLDDLTGLLRRNAFNGRAQTLLNQSDDVNLNVGMMVVDLDHFKKINDQKGHAAGDEVLKNVSAYLKKFENPTTVIGRFGGEEFVVAMEGSEREVEFTAELIRRGIERLNCTVSIGISHTNQFNYESDDLFKAADAALYNAKNGGRNQVSVSKNNGSKNNIKNAA